MPTLTLPTAAEPIAAPKSKKDVKVLMIDDEKLNSFVVAEYLKIGKYQGLVHTTEPLTAIELAKRERPNLILLDIEMPGLNGLDLLQMIREDSELADIKVLILSATVDDAIKDRLVELNAAGILKKPIRKNALLSELERLT